MSPPTTTGLGLSLAGLVAAGGLGGLCALASWPPGARRRVHQRLTAADAEGNRRPDPRVVHWPALVAAATGLGLLVAAGPAVTVVAASTAAGTAAVLHRRRRVERRQLRRRQLPGALDRIATALRGGSSLPVALAEAGAAVPAPLGPELTTLGREAAGGRALVDVLDGWTAAHGDAGTRLAATAMVLATVVGAAPARAVDGVATTLRERVDLTDERRALAAQARLSALVLSVAPLGFGLMLGLTDGPAGRFLLGTPAGATCLVGGVTLDLAGAWWMARLTRGHDR